MSMTVAELKDLLRDKICRSEIRKNSSLDYKNHLLLMKRKKLKKNLSKRKMISMTLTMIGMKKKMNSVARQKPVLDEETREAPL